MALGAGSLGGGSTVGTGVVKVKPDASGFSQELDSQVTSQGNKGASKAGAATSAAFKGAFFAGAAAIGKGVFDFANFDQGMREVFTLMPDITDDAMSKMTEQVKGFAGEFGVLPNEVIPSLYDSLSAGVPPDNVFEFLETANQLAKAGATDLSVAVDGLTSVTNAYGTDVLSAADASDILFTAVKLGKTTVDEMSGALFQVAPIAASFGVSFEEVSASIATLTAQGTPTSVAATQMKSAIAELGKSGTKASDAFQAITDKTFPQFIEGGGTLSSALSLMSEEADETDSSLVDMFGSIEAGQAALGITKDLGKTSEALFAMSESAGATEEAFEVMDQGLSATMDRLKARFSVVLINLGESLAPTLEILGEGLAGLVEVFTMLPGPMQAVVIIGGTMLAGMIAFSGPLLRTIKLFGMLNKAMLVLAGNPWILVVGALILAAFLIWKNWDTITAALADAWQWMQDTSEEVGEFFVAIWTNITSGVTLAFQAMTDAISGFALDIANAVLSAWNMVIGATQTAWNTVSNIVTTIGGTIVGFIVDIPNQITGAFSGLASLISTPFEVAFGAIKSGWNATVGGFGFTTPDWIPGLGGKSFTIPSMATGGVAANPMLALVGDAGPADPEVVSPVSLMADTMRGVQAEASSGDITIVMNVDAGVTDPQFFEDQALEIARVLDRERTRLDAGQGLPPSVTGGRAA